MKHLWFSQPYYLSTKSFLAYNYNPETDKAEKIYKWENNESSRQEDMEGFTIKELTAPFLPTWECAPEDAKIVEDVDKKNKNKNKIEDWETEKILSYLIKKLCLSMLTRKGEVKVDFHVNCDMVFVDFPAYEDWEVIPPDEMVNLYHLYNKYHYLGVAAWCALHRGEKPLKRIEENLKRNKIWDDKFESLKPNRWENRETK